MSKKKDSIFQNSLFSDAKARISKRKKFNDHKYRLYTTAGSSKNAHAIKKRLINWMKKSTPYSRREENAPVVYDTTWGGKKRFKVYIPTLWKGVPDV